MKIIYLIISLIFYSNIWCYDYTLSICMIFQDDAPYLKEWIEFHRLLGVEHFYLFNNLSRDHYKKVLDPYVKRKIVELIDWPYEGNSFEEWDKIQVEAYNFALKKCRKKTKWLAVLDSDEFLFPTSENDLCDFLKGYEDYGGLCVNWVVYGTSDIEKIPPNKLLIETLVMSARNGSDHFKSIVRPNRVKHFCSPHYAIYVEGYYHVMANHQPLKVPFNQIETIRINHYWSRDKHYLYHVKIPRREKWGTNSETCELWGSAANGHYDTSIFRFIEPLRKKMRFRN